MKRLKILAILLVVLTMFFACNKDDDKTKETSKKDSISKIKTSSEEDPDAWWQQYTTKPTPKTTKTTSKNSSASKSNSTTNANKTSTTADKSSSDSNSGDTNKGTTSKTAPQPYTKVDQYTMTYNNGGGGKTTLTYYPNNKFIKAAISDLSSTRGESYPANQMMYFSYTYKNKSGNLSQEDIVFVYSSASRSNSTLVYTITYNTDAKLKPVLGGSEEYAFFPYAGSGTSSYNTYRTKYTSQMEKLKKGYYDEVKNAYTSVGNQENVKVFLSW